MKNKPLFLIIAVLIAGAFFLNQKQDEFGIKVHYYDKNGEEIKQNSLFSLINPPGIEADYISFDITGSTKGLQYSQITVADASPIEFKNALPTTQQSIKINETKVLFSSDLIQTTTLEKYPQPMNFTVKISAIDDYNKKTVNVQGSLVLTIEGKCKPYPLGESNVEETYVDVDGCQHWSYGTESHSSGERCCIGYWMTQVCSPPPSRNYQFTTGGNCWYDSYCEGGGERCDMCYCDVYPIEDYGGLK